MKDKTMVVWKYKLQHVSNDISMPLGARVIHFGMQGDVPNIWVLVDSQAPTENRRFIVVGTGAPIDEDPNSLRFVGTAFLSCFVLHCFEVSS